MKAFIRIALFAAVVALVMGMASVAVAAPRLGPGLGWDDGPHGSYPGYCLTSGCHTGFQIWPAPGITQGDTPTHGPRGGTCTQCHTVAALPPADIATSTVVPAAVSTSEVTLGWTPISGAASYRVFRATASGGPFTQIASTTGLAFNDTGRTAGATYYYQVKGAIASGALGPASSTVSAKTYAVSTVRVDSTIGGLTLSTAWKTLAGSKYYGGSTRSTSTSGKKITVPFRGSSVTWYGTKGRSFGKGKVYIDGVYRATVDLYASSTYYNRALYTRSGLSDGPHTLAIVVSTSKNSRSTGRRLDVDSFGIKGTSPGVNQEDSKAVFAGDWAAATGASYSGAACKSSESTTATATYTFYGTGVTWLGTRSTASGKAQVYVDGVLKATVDLWAGRTTYARRIFATSGLPKGTHAVQIVPVGTHNAVATGNAVAVDAFVTR
ncbi:MAG: hypothetical protein HY876_10305 [Coriobacteriales bacterium]|nr:hypothetical protein [Coriobacteriales bacterium]